MDAAVEDQVPVSGGNLLRLNGDFVVASLVGGSNLAVCEELVLADGGGKLWILGLLASTMSKELFSKTGVVDPVMMTVIVKMRKLEDERG
jgi:hypothetical protein